MRVCFYYHECQSYQDSPSIHDKKDFATYIGRHIEIDLHYFDESN